MLRGELGWSSSTARPVSELLLRALPPTLQLAVGALLVHLLVGLGAGLLAARFSGSLLDRSIRWVSATAYAMPVFWAAQMAILLFSLKLGWFPAGSQYSVDAGTMTAPARFLDLLHHLALPAAVLGVTSAAATARFVRSGLLVSRSRLFVRAARARGLGATRVLGRHALRHALGPVVTLIGLSLPFLLSGSLVVETIFAWPGMGRLTFDAIRAQDFPVALAATILSTLFVVLGNLGSDIALATLDPRVRLSRRRPA